MILAIIQARVLSTRLPGKVLKRILGKPMLKLQLERVLLATRIDKLIVATSVDPSDEKIKVLCEEMGIPCYRGDLDDVLDRFYQAAKTYDAQHVVRLTGDCPLIDPRVVDQVVEYYLAGGYDYASNTVTPTFPDGLDVEIFRFLALQKAWESALLPSEREHVTPFIRNHTDIFKIGAFRQDLDMSHLRWTVDEPEDFELVSLIYEKLYPSKPGFFTSDILDLLNTEPELIQINKCFERNEGYKMSLEDDKRTLSIHRLHIPKSFAMQERAKKRIPGLSQLLSKRPDMFSYGVWPGYYSRAKGVEVWDLDGNRYIDMSIGGIGANILGYADPDVDEAVRNAVSMGTSSSLNCYEEVELAELLCELHPWADKVRFARTGGESMTIAVRIARAATGRDKIAFCGYHGWHDWYLAANLGAQNALGEHLLPGLLPAGVPKGLTGTALPFRYNQIEELEAILAENHGEIAAIVMEPIRNEQPKPGFFDRVRELAAKNGAVFIIDEISAGFRMNTGGAHLKLGIEPDIAVFSKALGNGYPIAAVIGKASVMDAAQRTFISSTYWTERIGPSAAIATIQKHRACNVGDHLMHIGEIVQSGWKRLATKHDLPIRLEGIPPLSHFTFQDESPLILKALFVQWMIEKGFLGSTIFYSMYAHTEEHVALYLEAAEEVFDRIFDARASGTPEKYLMGQTSATGFKRLN